MQTRIVQCPRCKLDCEYGPGNPNRPFCSERCKQIDLGDWAEEKFRVPLTETPAISELSEAEQDDESMH